MDGWLRTLPEVELRAGPVAAAALEPALRAWRGQSIHTQPRIELAETAELSVREAVKRQSSGLVPDEIRMRHRQKFVDGLWMRGLATAGVAYMACVFIYLIALNIQKYRLDDLKDDVNSMARKYTNAIQLKAQIDILQEQVDLRYAALDCWKAVVERLPETLTLEQLDFRGGRTLMLRGITTEESRADVTKFNSELIKATVDGQPIFSEVRPASINQRGNTLAWDFNAELKRAEPQ
jgi:hypothetical protein